MKLRIAAALAVVAAVVAIGMWLALGSSNSSFGPQQFSQKSAQDPGTATGPARGGSNLPDSVEGSFRPPGKTSQPIVRKAGVEPYGLPVSTGANTKSTAQSRQHVPVSLPAGTSSRSDPTSPEAAAAAIEADKVSLMIRDYRTRMGENPVGTNAEIMKAIMGGNAAKATLGPPEDQKLNDNGELIDRWGTPYFFHQLSAQQMEIRSAGPDKQMWTDDDILVR
jgi:hypothetical protein